MHRETAESTNSRVVWWTLVEASRVLPCAAIADVPLSRRTERVLPSIVSWPEWRCRRCHRLSNTALRGEARTCHMPLARRVCSYSLDAFEASCSTELVSVYISLVGAQGTPRDGVSLAVIC